MKLVSWFLSSRIQKIGKLKNFFLSPYLSVRGLNYHVKPNSPFAKLFINTILLTFIIVISRNAFGKMSGLETIIFSPVIYVFTEFVGALGQTIFFQQYSFPIHKSPLKATSLSHFWGRHWNLWVNDWLRDISEKIKREHRIKKIVVVFMFSGLFHELMCNLPYWIYYKKSYFGTMMAYFFIQAIALWIDKKYIKHLPRIYRRIYLWIVVIIPSPLFINVPLLTFFGLKT